MGQRNYQHPPIAEALVEFRFRSVGEWNWIIPGKLHSALEQDYPTTQNQNFLEAAVGKQMAEGLPSLAVRGGVARVQMLSTNGNRLVSVGPDVVSIHLIQPYTNWDDFRGQIKRVLEEYIKLSNKADTIERIGVRYVNKIIINDADAKYDDYFAIGPRGFAGSDLSYDMAAFISRCEYRTAGGVKLVATHATIDSSKETTAFLLDLDAIREQTIELDCEKVLGFVDLQHDIIAGAFEASITDEARRVFDGN